MKAKACWRDGGRASMSATSTRTENWEVTAKQIRAARAYLSWTEAKLAQMSKLTMSSVRRIERDGGVSARELRVVRGALVIRPL